MFGVPVSSVLVGVVLEERESERVYVMKCHEVQVQRYACSQEESKMGTCRADDRRVS